MRTRRRNIITKAPDKGRYIMLRLGVGVHYAEKDGRMVLRNETAWHKICGIWINTPWGCWWIQFRRFGRVCAAERRRDDR